VPVSNFYFSTLRALIAGSLLLTLTVGCGSEKGTVVVGSKNFTESVILGELIAQTIERSNCSVTRKLNLGGTLICDRAITAGEIDAYPEYSGTALTAVLGLPTSTDRVQVLKAVREGYAKRGIIWGPDLGFENTFAVVVRKADSTKDQLANISDLVKVRETYRPGFGYEFTERPDGWTGLQNAYAFKFSKAPVTMELGLTYRALAAGQVDVIAGNSTDGIIQALDLVVLKDDRRFFPPYDTAIVRTSALRSKCPAGDAALEKLANSLTEDSMRALNRAVDVEKKAVEQVVREWIESRPS